MVFKRKPPPSRRIIRHIFRARGEAVRAIASFFVALEAEGDGKQVLASVHLAKMFGSVEKFSVKLAEDGGSEEAMEVKGYRRASEVVAFLISKGAKIPTLPKEELDGEWDAMLSSEEETTTPRSEKCEHDEDMVWVASGTQMD